MTGALALLCVLFSQRYAANLSGSAGTAPMVALILSNQSAAAYLPGSFQPEQNNLPADTFQRASHKGFAPSVALLPVTNHTKQP